MLTPPEAFGCVEDGVYRCSSLNPANLQFISTLGLQVIITLNAEKPSRTVRTFASENGIDLIHLGIQPWRSTKSWLLFSKDLLQDALTYILDARKHPILVIDSSSSFIGMVRKIQHWTYSSVVSEYRVYAGSKTHYMTEIFLELLDVTCVPHDEYPQRKKQYDEERKIAAKKRLNVDENESMYSASYPDDLSTKMLLRAPPDDVLPDWFLRQRQMWDDEENGDG